MESELKNKILDLIESPELHAYLLGHTERLKLKDYVSIIAGAPISLERKQDLLHDMKRSSCLKKQEMDYVSLCCSCVDRAVQSLTSEDGTIFLIQFGALKHGNYFFNHQEVEQYLSPLYRARIVAKDELSWDEIVRRSKNGNKTA